MRDEGYSWKRSELVFGTVRIELIVADLDFQDVDRAAASLSGDERQRAGRFASSLHRDRFIAGRGLLRYLLAARLGRTPAGIEMETNAFGKPRLASSAAISLRFNASHSANILLIGLASECEIGVDVETIETTVDRDGIAGSFFSPAEHAAYLALDEADRPAGFARCWTRKEAFIKALGEGLHCALQSFDVSLGPETEARVLRTSPGHGAPADWSLRSFAPCPGYIASVAVDRRQRAAAPAGHARFQEGADARP